MTRTRIGMASFAHMHAGSYAAGLRTLPDAEIAAIWDYDDDRGHQMAEQFETSYEPDLDRFLALDTQGVIICTENARHREITVACAEAGKHVMCEKPLATSVEDGQAMIDACRKAGVELATAFPCRFSPAMQRLKETVDAGKLGRIVGVAGTNRGRMPGGWFIELEKSGGGAVIDHTVHVTDLLRYMTGANPTRVYAEISNLMYGLEFDDCGLLTIEFDNGMFATLDSSWSRPKTFPTWGDVTMEVVGTEGTASLDMFNQKFITYMDNVNRVNFQVWGSNIDAGLVRAFVDTCQGHKSNVIASGEDGLRALEVALGAYESARTGSAVTVGA